MQSPACERPSRRRFGRIVVTVLVVAAVAGATAGAARAHAPQFHKAKLVAFDQPVAAPAFKLMTADGQVITLAALRGKTVLLNFWATWCPPCVREMPSLQRLSRKLAGEPFVVLAISLDASGLKVVRPFVDKLGLTFPIALDPLSDVGGAYGARDLPTTFVLDAQGRVVAAAKGAREWDDPAMIEYLREWIAQSQTRG